MPTHRTVLIITNIDESNDGYERQLQQEEEFAYQVVRAGASHQILALVQSQQIDALVVELDSLKAANFEVLEHLKDQIGDRCPPIVVIGSGDAEVAVRAFKLGVTDYLVKDQLTPNDLCLTIQSAIATAELQRKQQHSQERFQAAVATMLDCFGIFSSIRDQSGQILDFQIDYLNVAACASNQMPQEMQIGRGLCEILPVHRQSGLFDDYCRLVETGEPLIKDLLAYEDTEAGQRLEWAFNIRAVPLNDGFVASWRDITQSLNEQKQAEADIQQLNQDLTNRVAELQTLLDILPVGIAIANDPTCTQMQSNAYIRHLLGTNPGTNISKSAPVGEQPPYRVFQNGQELPAENLPMQIAARLGVDVRDAEFEIVLPDGTLRHILAYATPLQSNQSELRGAIGAFLDITERKHIEATLQQKIQEAEAGKQILDALMEYIPEGIAIADAPDARIRKVSRYGQELTGRLTKDIEGILAAEQVTAWNIFEADGVTPATPDGLPLFRAAQQGEVVTNEEWVLQKPDGQQIVILCNAGPIYNAKGEITGGIVAWRDISDRKRVEVERQRSEAILQAFVAASPIAFALFDRELRFLYANEALAKIHEIPLSEHLGRTVWEVIPQLAPQFAPLLLQIMATQKPITNLEFNGEVKAGVFRSTIANHYPVCLSSGEVIGVGVAVMDVSALTQAQQELQESEARFRTLADNISQFAWMADESGAIFWYNQRWFDYTGTTLEDMQGWGWQQVHHPDYVERVVKKFRHCLATGETWEDTFPLRGKDGEYRWFLSRAIQVRDAQGKVLRWFGTNTDVTELKATEEKLQKSEAEFRTISNAAPAIVWVSGADGKIVFFNERWYEYTGQTEAEAVGYGWVEVLHPDDAVRVLPYWERCQQMGETYRGEARYRRYDGEYCWHSFRALPRYGSNGQIEAWYGLSIDISDRKQAELEREHLLARERHYVNQLQGLTAAALAINSALSVEQVLQVITNQAASIIGAHQSVTSITINQNWAQAINAVYLSDKYAQWQDYHAQPDGSGIYACVCHLNRPMRMTQAELEAHPQWHSFGTEGENHPPLRGWLAAPLMGRDGHNIGLIQLSDKYEDEFTEADQAILIQLAQMASVAIENAQLYEAEQQARSAAEASREEAERANRVKDEFLAVLSHELRSPLNPILGWSRLLQTHKFDEAKTAAALATIERNARLQTQLIDDLLDVARILRGKLSLDITPVNLPSVIEAAIDTVRAAATAKSISLHPILPNVGQVCVDAARLQQIVWNLLSNAIKFTQNHGQVTIKLERVGDQAAITVSDTGKGINPDFLPHLFESFRQEDASTTRKYGGLGLGLAIVRQLVEAHGGTITADSPGEGLGATFTVYLPLVNVELETQQADESPQPELDLTGIRVLAVDDDPDARELLTASLSQYRAEVLTVASAVEFLSAFESFQPHVLISDIGIPEVDGYGLIQQVRALPADKGGQIPAIALTAYAREEDYQQAIFSGYQRHLTKPLEPEQLVQAVIALLSTRHKG